MLESTRALRRDPAAAVLAAAAAVLAAVPGTAILDSPELGVHALEYAVNGWEVFPLDGKRPLAAHGFYDATDDLDQILAWWRRWPTANIGARIPHGLVMLDTDPRHAGGRDPLADRGPLPPTLTSASGRGDGGLHRYFLHPGGRVFGTRLPDHVDLQHRDLRYAVMPPSLHPATGKPYLWVDTSAPAPAPGWLTELLCFVPPPKPPSYRWTPTNAGNSRPRLDALAGAVAAQPEGKRNGCLYWAGRRAGELVAAGLDPGEIRAELAAAAAEAGLPRREAETTIASAFRAEGIGA